MYISPKQLAARLEGQDNLELRGREGIGKRKELPRETKILAGVLAKFDTQKNVAAALGTSQANVSNITNNPELKDEIKVASNGVREQVSNKAVDVLMKTLGVVENRIGITKTAGEASQVAKNISGIIQQFTPREREGSATPRILINIHGSKQKSEEAYETIDVESVSQ